MPIKAAFFMEQHIGHRTFYENVRRFVDIDPQIQATWIEVTYNAENSLWKKLPLLPSGLRGTMMGREQVRRGLQNAADITVFNTQVPAALAAGMVRKRPYILCTDITPLQYDRMGAHYNHQPDSDGPLSAYKHRVNAALFQGAARLLPWSTWAADSLEKEYGAAPDQIDVIPPGVDIEKWQPDPKQTNGPARLLFVGGDFYRKGGETLLQAFQQLPAGSAELVLVTRSPISETPGIIVYGDLKPNTAELINLYQSCDIFVLPTAAEAFGIAAIEAGAVGLPIIATQVGGLVDIVVEGETGFLIPEGDAAALADRLNQLLTDTALRQKMGQGARVHVEQHFDARKNVGRLIEIVKDSVRS